METGSPHAGQPLILRLKGNAGSNATVFDGVTILGQAQLNPSGDASYSLKGLRAGRHTLYVLSGGKRSRPVTIDVPAEPFPGYELDRYDSPVNGASLALADFDRDGHPDLALAGAGAIAIFRGKEDGTLNQPVTIAVDGNPAALIAADFNGDGIPDLAFADATSGAIRIFIGAGDGSFQPLQPVTALHSISAMATADFNGDGIADLAVADASTGAVSILAGNGDGTFAAPASVGSVSSATAIAVGDFNHDGIADLAAVSTSTNSAVVWLGNGDGSFAAPLALSTGSAPSAIVAADVDGDGIDDLAVLSPTDSSIALFYSNGDGTFQQPVNVAGGGMPGALAPGDPEQGKYRGLVVADSTALRIRRLDTTGLWGTNSFDAGGSVYGLATAGLAGAGRLWVAAASVSEVIVLRPQVPVSSPPSIAKSFSPSTIQPGGTSTLTFTITNSNATALTGVGFTDALPPGMTVAASPNSSNTCSGTFNPSAGNSTLTLSGGSVAASSSCLVKVDVTASVPGTYNNTSGVVTSTEQGNGNTASATLTVEAPPQIAASFNPTAGPPSTTTTLTITVTNPAGNPADLQGVGFTDILPNGLAFVSATSSCTPAYDSNAGTYSGATVPVNGSCTLMIQATVTTTGTFVNTAGPVTSTNGGTGTSASATFTAGAPPTITKDFAQSSVARNSTIGVSFTIVNSNADVTLTGISFTDSLPAGLVVSTNTTNNSNSCGGTLTAVAGSSSISFTGGTLGPEGPPPQGNRPVPARAGSRSKALAGLAPHDVASGICVITVSLLVTAEGGSTLNNTTGPISANESGPGNPSNTATVNVISPPTLNKAFGAASIPRNGTTSLTFNLANPNSSTNFQNVTITDMLPNGMVIATPNGFSGTCTDSSSVTPGSSTISLVAASLNASGSCSFVVNITAGTAGILTNTTGNVTATYDPGDGSTAVATGGTASASVTVVAPPDMSISFAPVQIAPGSTSVLTFTIANHNTAALGVLSGVSFNDTLPAGVIVATPNGLTNTCNGTAVATAGSGSVTLDGGSIPLASTCRVTVNVTSSAAGTYNNIVTVNSTNGGTGDTANANLFVANPPVVTKSFGASQILAGGTTGLSISIQNPNNIALTNLTFTDSLPSGMTVAATPGLSNTCGGAATATVGSGTVALVSGTVAANGSCLVTVTVQGASGTLTNTVTVSSREGGNSNTSSATLIVMTAPTFGKAFNPATVSAGATSALTFTLTNPSSNSLAITGVAFTDTLPSNLVVATPNALTNNCGGSATATAGGSSVTLTGGSLSTNFSCTVVVNVTSTLPNTYTNTTSAVTTTNAGTGTTASATLTVNPAAATHFTVSAPSAATAGTSFSVTVTALDQFNNTATGYSGTVHFSSTDTAASLQPNTILVNGTGSFGNTLKTAGNQTITATDTVTGSVTGVSGTIVVSPASGTHFSVSAPANVTAGTPLSVTVTAQDPFNNVVTGYTGTVRFSSSDPQAVLPSNSTLTHGVGSFSATLKTSGFQTITATDTANASVTGTSGTITVGVASSSVHFNVSAPASTTAGAAFNFTVTAADPFNNTVTTYAGHVNFTSSDSKAVLPGSSTLTSGVGTFSATLKTSGSQTITATDSATPAFTGSASITVNPGAPAGISIVTGNSQSATVDTRFGLPLTILVVDAYGNPIPGVTVTFNAPGSGASVVFFQGSSGTSVNLPSASMAARPRRDLHPEVVSGITATAVTNSQGLASISVQANAQAGTYTVEADAGGNSVLFTLTNTFPDRPALTPQLDPSFLILHYTQAAPGSTPTPAASATVSVTTQLPSTYIATASVPWVTVTPSTNTTNHQATISATGANLAPGIYSTNVIFTFADNSVVLLPLQLYVIGPPSFKPDSAALTFIIAAGSTTPQTQSFIMRSAGADFSGTLTVQDVSGNGGAWLTATPSSFSTPKQIQVTVDPTGLAAGTYQKNLVFAGPVGNSPFTVPVTLTVVNTSQAIQ